MWISLATANVFISHNFYLPEPTIVELENDALTGNLRALENDPLTGNLRAELVDTFQPTTFHRTVDRSDMCCARN